MWNEIIPQLLLGALVTVKISIISIVIGAVGGTLIGIVSSKGVHVPYLRTILKGYVSVVRGTPLFIQLLIIYFSLPELIGLDLSPLSAGILALGLNSMAYISEIIRGGVNVIPSGQWEACHSLGYSTYQTFRFTILPQTFRNVFPSLTNEFVSLVKESSILMILGVQELTKVSKDIVSRELNPFEVYVLTATMYFLITSSISILSKKFEGGKQCIT